ncbi:MAG TPA: T9SS type A sorting domain-containing protein, partial [candidate division WOR-3 bacterium]|nr:T9SS type A sorting domain-containing protein [candidate division WOR-3 bacterium]
TVTAQDVKGLLVPDNEDMTFYGMLDTRVVGPHRVNYYDTIQVFLRDIQGNRIYLDGVYRDDSLSFSVSQIGGSNAYSVSMPDGDRTTFVDGFCSVRITDSEEETLEISTFPYNTDWYHGYETASYIGITGISEPSPFQIKLNTVQKGVLSFQFGMNAMGSVSIELFDIAGRCVFRRDMILKPGTYTVVRENLPSGVYYLRLSRGKQQVKGKVVYIK